MGSLLNYIYILNVCLVNLINYKIIWGFKVDGVFYINVRELESVYLKKL